MQQVQDNLVGEGGSPMMGHSEMTVMLGGLEVGVAVGVELMTSEWIWINMKP